MNFSALVNLFEAYTQTDGAADNVVLALWFNEAEADLAYDLGPVVKYTYTEEAAEYEPPLDCLRILAGDFSRTPQGKLVFSGDKTIYYRQLPASFTGADGEAESPLPLSVHPLLAMFAASRYWDQESEGDGEESAHATKWMNYYQLGKARAVSRLDLAGERVERWNVL